MLLTKRKMNSGLVICIMVSLLALHSCSSSKYGYAVNKEEVDVKVDNKRDVIQYAMLQNQMVPTLASRGPASRGLPSGFVGGIVSIGTKAIKQMIDKEKKKYTAEWKQGLNDLYFYDQLSKESAFDPIGMQFEGFKLIRTFDNNGVPDTALTAEFELDTSNPYQIINNSVFRLKLKSLTLNYAKAKVPANKNTLNMDFEITFNTSYVNEEGVLFKNVELGKFVYRLREAPLDKNAEGYANYYKKLEGKMVDGWSFIVPRSYGYHIDADKTTSSSFSQGAYSININVKESSKNNFVNTLIVDNSGKMIDELEGQVKKRLK